MASGYWIALAIYFGFFAWSVYRWCMSDIRLFGKPVSVVLLDPLLIIITLAVPYTLGRGKRFPTLMVLVLWVALGSVRKAMF